MSLKTLVSVLSSNVLKDSDTEPQPSRTIRFPYSRHSSYSELCGLVKAFGPKDVFPCTVDDVNWTPDLRMQNLFGDLCLGEHFRHDAEMMKIYEARLAVEGKQKQNRGEFPTDTQMTDDAMASPTANKRAGGEPDLYASSELDSNTPTKLGDVKVPRVLSTSEAALPRILRKVAASDLSSEIDALTPSSQKRQRRTKHTNRQIAYDAAIGDNGLSWSNYGGLVSTRSKDVQDEQEL